MALLAGLAVGAGAGVVQGLFGGTGDAPRIERSGFFPAGQTGELSANFANFLNRRLTEDPETSLSFQRGRELIRSEIRETGRAARQRARDAARSRGRTGAAEFLDFELESSRQENRALGQALTQLILSFENTRDRGVFPFISAAASEATGVSQANAQTQAGLQAQDASNFNNFLVNALGGVNSTIVR